jgi:sugar phosphate isomerase/epimerase
VGLDILVNNAGIYTRARRNGHRRLLGPDHGHQPARRSPDAGCDRADAGTRRRQHQHRIDQRLRRHGHARSVLRVEGRADDVDPQRSLALATSHPRQPAQRRLTPTEGEDRVKREEEAVRELAEEAGKTRIRPIPTPGHRAGGRVLPTTALITQCPRRGGRRRARHRDRSFSHARGLQHLGVLRWFDDFVAGTRDYLAWIREAPSLGGEGIEHYDGFLRSFDAADVDPVIAALADTGQPTSLVCFSPDFTHPDADERARQVQRQRAAIDQTLRLGGRHCRTLSGQRYPGMTRADGSGDARRAGPIDHIVPSSAASSRAWRTTADGTRRYPEFAQPEDIFLEIIERIDSPASRAPRRTPRCFIRSRSRR